MRIESMYLNAWAGEVSYQFPKDAQLLTVTPDTNVPSSSNILLWYLYDEQTLEYEERKFLLCNGWCATTHDALHFIGAVKVETYIVPWLVFEICKPLEMAA